MTFYLKPPSGEIRLEKLMSYSHLRIMFLINVTSCNGDNVALHELLAAAERQQSQQQKQLQQQQHCVDNPVSTTTQHKGFGQQEASDCLIAGSANDVVSHWIVRMACSNSENCWQFFENAEVDLFTYRFNCLNVDELVSLIRTTKRHINYYQQQQLQQSEHDLSHLSKLINCRSSSTLAKFIYEANKDEYILLPFQEVLPLVATRQVNLVEGLARVTFSQFYILFRYHFKALLERSRRKTLQMLDMYLNDARYSEIITQATSLVQNHLQKSARIQGFITAAEIPEVVELSPLCIHAVHKALMTSHKIHHNARFKYTLYQKEAGLPVQEAISFWKEEYSKSKNWAHRYIYNIRHMYGLEGSKRNYCSHDCQQWQESAATGDEGCCPFTHWDSDSLTSCLIENRQLPHSTVSDIVSLAQDGKPQCACALYCSQLSSANCSEYSGCRKPTDYYNVTQNAMNSD